MNTTSGHSFILKPSTIVEASIGVFILHDVDEGTYMELFVDGFEEESHNKEDIPEELRGYCIDQEGGKVLCPKFFNRMDIGNYLNHSITKANLRYEEGKGFFATRDIKKGEELLIDYRQLGEPEDTWDEYYNE